MITLRGSPLPDDEKYVAGIFFDNDKNKIINVSEICPGISTIHVPETAYHVTPKSFDSPEMQELMEQAGGDDNIYIHLLKNAGYTSDSYDFISGFSPEVHGPTLASWIGQRNDPTKSIILLDWDRTITVIEGFMQFDYEKYSEYSGLRKRDYYNDFLRYLCGGDTRLYRFRELLDFAGERGIDVCILTNNSACNSDVFSELVDTLVPSSVENLFIACSIYAPFNGNKGQKLKSMPQFSDLCKPEINGGFKRRRRLRSRKLSKRHRRTCRARKIQ